MTLEVLNLSGYINLREIPPNIRQLKRLNSLELSFTGITDLPYWLDELPLTSLIIYGCDWSTGALPDVIGRCSHLVILSIGETQTLTTLCENIGNLQELEILYMGVCCNLERLPKSFGCLNKLKEIHYVDIPDGSAVPIDIGHNGSHFVTWFRDTYHSRLTKSANLKV